MAAPAKQTVGFVRRVTEKGRTELTRVGV